MDIKLLLLKSLSLKKSISGSHRIYCGKSCFVIKYVINGKVLSIKSIKQRKKRITWSQRIKYKKWVYKIQRHRKNNGVCLKKNLLTTKIVLFGDKETMTEAIYRHAPQDAQTKTSKISLTTNNVSTQTIDVQKHTREAQTETLKNSPNIKEIIELGLATNVASTQNQAVSFTSTAQQTIACIKYNRNMGSANQKTTLRNYSKSCQTDLNTECKGIQCKRSTQVKATNTDINTRDSFTQAQNDLLGVLSPVETSKLLALPIKDFEVFIYMLNEIGETVVNQNQILNNNTEMMKQIMHIDSIRMGQSCRSISTQTDQLVRIETKNNFSQTKANCKKPRKLLLFKGRNTQHNT